jgi:hypothetical protein
MRRTCVSHANPYLWRQVVATDVRLHARAPDWPLVDEPAGHAAHDTFWPLEKKLVRHAIDGGDGRASN